MAKIHMNKDSGINPSGQDLSYDLDENTLKTKNLSQRSLDVSRPIASVQLHSNVSARIRTCLQYSNVCAMSMPNVS